MKTSPTPLKSDQYLASQQPYLDGHSEEITAREHGRTFSTVSRYVTPGRVLDWGCFSANDAERVQSLNGSFELFGCDIHPPLFRDKWVSIGMDYQQLNHPHRLPYPDAYFSTIIGSGVIEHVPHEQQSLLEIWRVLEPNGRLILTYAPLRFSVIELIQRVLGMPHHKRRYTLSGLRRLLINHGFIPVVSGYHHSTPMRGPKFLRWIWFYCAPLLERLLGPFQQNGYIVAEKTFGIGGEYQTGTVTVYGLNWSASKPIP